MNRDRVKKIFWRVCEPIILVLFVYACANRGYPEGGPKDETPPEILLEEPVSFSTNLSIYTFAE